MTYKQWFNNVLHLHPVHEEGAKTCVHNGHYFERSLDLTSCECGVKRVERLCPDINAEDS